MRILLLDGAPCFGGQARHVRDLAFGLRDRGHEVYVSCNHEKLYETLQGSGVTLLRAKFRYGPDLPTILLLSRAIRSLSIDVVHTHGVRAGVTGRLAARLGGCKKVVHSVHTMSEDLIQGNGVIGKLNRLAYTCADRWFSRWTDSVITVSDELRSRTIGEGVPKDKVITVYSGIDVSRYQNKPNKQTARNRLGIPNGCRVVGTTARFTRQKNLGDLLRAARVVSKKVEDVTFALVGDGEEMTGLKSLAHDLGIAHKVFFPGFRENIAEILPAFDVFAMSSLWEGHSLAILEAMAAGLAVVATDVAGVRETVVEGVTGCIVPVSDHETLADAICQVLSNGRSEAMGAAGRERAAELFSLERMVEQIEWVYMSSKGYTPSRTTAEAAR
ncbi:MAG: glycosyltransferase family 4 protein [Armatimonadetes bacterium]|nr:glycosyltransferase family 4 protein [Armatimonadota bacterium]